MSQYSVDVSNEVSSTPNTIYSCDSNGNMLTKIDSTGTTGYTWDFENRISSVTLPGTGGTVSFKYGLFGRRSQKAVTSGANPPTTTTTNYLYDGVDSIEEVDPNGSALTRYARTLATDEPLARRNQLLPSRRARLRYFAKQCCRSIDANSLQIRPSPILSLLLGRVSTSERRMTLLLGSHSGVTQGTTCRLWRR